MDGGGSGDGRKRINTRLAHWVASAALMGSFVVSISECEAHNTWAREVGGCEEWGAAPLPLPGGGGCPGQEMTELQWQLY